MTDITAAGVLKDNTVYWWILAQISIEVQTLTGIIVSAEWKATCRENTELTGCLKHWKWETIASLPGHHNWMQSWLFSNGHNYITLRLSMNKLIVIFNLNKYCYFVSPCTNSGKYKTGLGSPFSNALETVWTHEGIVKSQPYDCSAVLFSDIPKMNRGSLHKSFRHIHFSVFKDRWFRTKNDFKSPFSMFL